MIMSGRLGEWSIEDLLQIARITHKTTSIEVIGERQSGVIFLRSGAIVDAHIDGKTPPGGSRFSQVVEAIERLSALEDGSFQFGTREVPFHEDRPIEVSAVTAAMEKDAVREKRLAELGMGPAEVITVARHVDGPLNIKPAVWQLVADLVEPFSLVSLEQRMGRRKAVATLLTLEAMGVLARDHRPDAEIVVPGGGTAPTMPPLAADQQGAKGVDEGEPIPVGASSDEIVESPWEGPVPDPVSEPHSGQEPIVEIFGMTPAHDEPMHEVVAPTDTILVSDVLGDMRSRFRSRPMHYEPDDDEDETDR